MSHACWLISGCTFPLSPSFVIWSVLFSSYSWWTYAYIKQKWGNRKNLDVEKTWHIFNHLQNAWTYGQLSKCISCWLFTFLAECNTFHLLGSFSELRKINFYSMQIKIRFTCIFCVLASDRVRGAITGPVSNLGSNWPFSNPPSYVCVYLQCNTVSKKLKSPMCLLAKSFKNYHAS